MIIICYVLAAVTIAFAALCITFRRKGKSFEGMMCKFMASFGFISTAIVGYCRNPSSVLYFCLVCFALLFGLGGDIVLGLKEIAPKFRGKLIPLGTGYFLIGHIFFLTALIKKGGFSPLMLIISIALGLVALAVMKLIKMNLDAKMTALLIVYYILLLFKAASACRLMIITKDPAFVLTFIGSLLFVVSDTCLGLLYFTPVKKKNFFVTLELSTYYTAQTFLALSIAYIR